MSETRLYPVQDWMVEGYPGWKEVWRGSQWTLEQLKSFDKCPPDVEKRLKEVPAMNNPDDDDTGNWASPSELAEALKSGEIDSAALLPPGANRQQRRAFAVKNKLGETPPPAPAPGVTTSRIMTDAWEKIEREIIPPGTSQDKRKWAKRLFMAGAFTLLSTLINSDVLDESDESTATPQDVNRVDAIWHELNAFFSAIAEMQ